MTTLVCPLADLDEHKPTPIEVADVGLVLVRDGDRVHAVRDECSHAEVALSEGEVTRQRGRLALECWLHGSCFDLTTGEPMSPPAAEPVDVFAVTIVDGQVHVDVSRPANRD